MGKLDEAALDKWLIASKDSGTLEAFGGSLDMKTDQREFVLGAAKRLGLYDEKSQKLKPEAVEVVNKHYPGLF